MALHVHRRRRALLVLPRRWRRARSGTLRGLGGEALREYSAHLGWSNYRDHIYRGGTLLATVASAAAGGTTKHLHTDHLGTPRLITDAAGNPATKQFHAYYPYGEELATTYTSSYTDRMRFTGHERDLVNLGGQGDDLDYMHARHYGVVMGRFLSVDPAAISAVRQAPQSWNRYAYTRNNALKFVDPKGEVLDVVFDIGFIVYDLVDIGLTVSRGESVATTQVIALVADVGAAVVPGLTGAGGAVRAGSHADSISHFSKAGAGGGDAAAGFSGHRGFELSNAPYQPVRNQAESINGRVYTGHALDQMQNRGIPISVVENAVKHGTASAGKTKGTTAFYDEANKVRVIVDTKSGRVITVMFASK